MESVANRPHDYYKRDLVNLINELAAPSLLDVGCGAGRLLREVAAPGRRCVGIEISHELVDKLALEGLEVEIGDAEKLGFDDGSFDVVVFDYTAHHLANLDRAFLEAGRVSRRAVLVLDPWHDLSIPSQRVAYDFDLWLKLIDRRRGLVHEPTLSAAQLMRPFLALEGSQLDCRYRLLPVAMPLEALLGMAQNNLDKLGGAPRS